MAEVIPPTAEALKEALSLSSEVLQNIELSQIPLTNIALKVSRLALLLNEHDMQKIMEYEASGYPSTPNGISPDIWQLVVKAGRKYEEKDTKTEQIKLYAWINSIAEWEQIIETAEKALESAREPDVSIVSANPSQYVYPPMGYSMERRNIRTNATTAARRIAERRGVIYSYALQKHYELKFSGIAGDIFSRVRERVDTNIGTYVPEAIQKLSAIHDNLRSENIEDWSNAVHSCRRILQNLADVVFPSQEDRKKTEKGKTLTIKLGDDNYINRLVTFVEDHSTSNRFKHIVGSHLRFIGDRLDSIFQAAQKGSHTDIVSPQEADRYVIYTYMVVADILSLLENVSGQSD